MKAHARTALAAVIATMLMCPPLLVGHADGIGIATAQTAPAKAGQYGRQVDLATVKQYAVLPKRADVTLVDARPAARKYDIGHIPTAINIPDSQFDQLAPKLLPQDKSQLVIFYCDGPECMLSHNSAFKAEKLGYSNVRVHVGGFPEWAKAGNLVAVSIPQLKKLLDAKEPLTLVDARPRERKYDKGHIPGAISLPDSQFDKLAAQLLPADKAAALYFYCEGLECKLSNDSAEKAVKLGYSNVRVHVGGFPEWAKAGNLVAVSIPQLKKLLDAKEPLTLVDARPRERKYDKGHIPGAISLPDSQFDKLAAQLLPADKAAALYFYCEGLECKLSNDSAEKAVKLGYSNVKVVPEGWPAWEKAYGAGVAAAAPAAAPAAAAPALVAGKEPGSIAVPSFEQIYREAPQSVHLIDVRDPHEFAAGTFKGAVNIPVGLIDKRLDQLPRDKPIVFFCGAGGRSGEAHDVVKAALPALKTVFIDATIKWQPSGEYTITAK